jgi:hypothetical protein
MDNTAHVQLHSEREGNLLITFISLSRSVITQGRFAGGLGQEFTEYILLGSASNSIHFISIKITANLGHIRTE